MTKLNNYIKVLYEIGGERFNGYDETDDIFFTNTKNVLGDNETFL